jgi:Na+-translocating ferredoxin:NAD+ oxidoreductase RnfG subunit
LKYVILFILISFQLPAQSDRVLKKATKLIEKTYNTDDLQLIQNNFEVNDVVGNLYNVFDKDLLMGYAFVGTALSKTDTFEYLVVFDQDLIIKKISVLVYREDYGGEIGSNRWLKQFTGKSTNTDFSVGENVAAISGATISVYSMTNAVNELLSEMDNFDHI